MAETIIYVSRDGRDTWSGSRPEPLPDLRDGPVATVGRARELVRELVACGLSAPVTMYLRQGCYFLDETLELDASMSGTSLCPVTISSYPGETATLSGGWEINGWQRGAGNLWSAKIPDGVPVFRTFRVGENLAERARYPASDPADPIRGGWLFADWWGKPWELGRFDLPLVSANRSGDWAEWTVDVPSTGEYRIWMRYVKTETDMAPVACAFGARGGDRAPTPPLGVTGPLHAFVYAAAGSITLEKGIRTLYWENLSGGDINLDAIALCTDPKWDPSRDIKITGWHTREYEVTEPPLGHHWILMQAEAATALKLGVAPPMPSGFRAPGSEPPGKRDRIHLRSADMPDWKDWEGAEIHVFPAWGWNNKVVPVDRVDRGKGVIYADFGDDIRPGNRFFIAGAAGALQNPGQWNLDTRTRTISYLSPEGSEPSGAVAAVLKTVVRISGRFIRVRDLVIADSDYTAPGSGADYESDAAVVFRGAEHCENARCRFECVNGWGVSLVERASHNLVEGNMMRGLGQGGVILAGTEETQAHDNTIVANTIEDCGRVYKHVAGVYADGSSRNLIAHNRIHRTPRYGISLKSGSRPSHDNVVEYNDLRDLNLETSDTGAIEVYGGGQKLTGNILRYNSIVNSVGLKMGHRGEFLVPFYSWGIYLDDWASGVTIVGNLIVGNVVGGVNMHGGWDNVIENNILVNGLDRQISLSPIFSDLKSTTLRNNTIRRNVVAYSRPESDLIWCRPNRWYPEILCECDHNLYWCFASVDLETSARATPVGGLADWRMLGFDRHSLVADPCFVDPSAGNFRLRDDSPAFALGFAPIPLDRIGPAGYRRG